MKNILFLFVVILFGVTIASAQIQELETIEYQGTSFELPLLLKKASKSFALNENLEGNLRNGGVTNRKLLVHPQNNSKDTIIGITFYNRCFTYLELKAFHATHFENFEKEYNLKFTEIDFEFFTSLNGKYYYLELENNITLVLGDVMYNAANNNYITVSYFKDIDVEEITEYLNAIY